ncbi:MAG TPA: hypothetical protein VFJ14_17750 [Nocardioidaceae bacterium]|nr:hypothetical protein [Nocardioidaceae bacterium]
MRTYRTLWFTLCGVLTVVGTGLALIWTVTATLILFSGAAAAGGAATVKVCRDRAEAGRAWQDAVPVVSVNALLTGSISVATVGLGALLGPWALLIVALAAGTSPYAVRRGGRCLRAHLGRQPRTDTEPSPAPETPIEMRPLSDAELCLTWRTSFTTLQRAASSTQRLRVVEIRQGCLDELERRHPDRLVAWLASGPRAAGDPGKAVTSPNAVTATIDWDRLLHELDT